MNRFVSLLLVLILFGCTTSFQQFAPGLDRVASENVNSGMPNFYLMDFEFQKLKRAPASQSKGQNSKLTKLNDKKIYFLTLYSQHLWMKSLVEDKEDLKTCPQFHHEMVTINEDIKRVEELYSKAKFRQKNEYSISEGQLPYFPELSLAVTPQTKVHDYLSSSSKSAILKTALSNHYKINKEEIKSLCEYGGSDNFYVFSNLTNHFRKNPEFHYSTEAFKALLKTTVFANMMLFQSMLGDTVALPTVIGHYPFSSYNKFEEELMSRVRVEWVKDYFTTLKTKRAVAVAQYKVQ